MEIMASVSCKLPASKNVDLIRRRLFLKVFVTSSRQTSGDDWVIDIICLGCADDHVNTLRRPEFIRPSLIPESRLAC